MKITKKRVVLFLLFIFPLICFLILSTGKNYFNKLPTVTKSVLDVSTIESSATLIDKISVICFLGDNIQENKTGFFNLHQKIYKKFKDHKKFQVIAISPDGNQEKVQLFKNELSTYSQVNNWKFIHGTKKHINSFYQSLKTKDSLTNFYSPKVYIIDKDLNLRGRKNQNDTTKVVLYGYNTISVAELSKKLEDDLNVLYYEYYAAFKEKNKNKADRKEVGL